MGFDTAPPPGKKQAQKKVQQQQQQQPRKPALDKGVEGPWREELGSLLERVRKMMTEKDDGRLPLAALMPRLSDAFGDDVQGGVAEAIRVGCRVANEIAAAAASASASAGAPAESPTDDERAGVEHVLSALYYVNHALSASTVAWRILAAGPDPSKKHDEDLAAGIARFSAPDPEETNRVQQLLLYLLNTAQVRGYRRRHGEMYRRVRPSNQANHDTHAWERVCDMRDFVYETTRKEVNYDMWLNMTCMRTNVQAAVDHLTSCHDVQLPELIRDRHVFSFSDGVYLAAEDRFVRYGTPGHAALPTELVAAKYFALPFDPAARPDGEDGEEDGDWYERTPTPHVQSILDRQDMTTEVCRWMYAMIGRLIYEVGELDGWQVKPRTFSLFVGRPWGCGPLGAAVSGRPTKSKSLTKSGGSAPRPLSGVSQGDVGRCRGVTGGMTGVTGGCWAMSGCHRGMSGDVRGCPGMSQRGVRAILGCHRGCRDV